MKKPIKLVIADIDGTLVKLLGETPSDGVKSTVQTLQDKGIDVTAATGRPYEMAKPVIKSLGLTGHCIVDAGASIRNATTGEIAWKRWIDVTRVKDIVQILLPFSKELDCSAGFNVQKPKDIEINDIDEDAPYVWAYVVEDHIKEVLAALDRVPNLFVHVHYPDELWKGYVNIQITTEGADKKHAVLALREIDNVTNHETLAIGDSANDIPLLEAAGTKVAMGNAIDDLKAIADYVVSTVDEDGFVEAMNTSVL